MLVMRDSEVRALDLFVHKVCREPNWVAMLFDSNNPSPNVVEKSSEAHVVPRVGSKVVLTQQEDQRQC